MKLLVDKLKVEKKNVEMNCPLSPNVMTLRSRRKSHKQLRYANITVQTRLSESYQHLEFLFSPFRLQSGRGPATTEITDPISPARERKRERESDILIVR